MVLYRPNLKKLSFLAAFFIRALKKTKDTQLCKYVHQWQTVDKMHSILF
ncbi:hypothetical protein N173_17910 [Acinetobacter baumannii EGD-HP18]|uniref:Transposase n=1 Tax=Acinetobacter baumannii EGD-HP18 TaxID=1358412 RepID=A0AAV3JYZ0_ACIBA|nr:hypothetical protein N173_17910 [Acinetobacter baumannii EGD-HP18]